MAADPSGLIPPALCIDRCIPAGLQLPVLISIFAKLANVSLDPATLIPDALCVNACIPPGYQMAVLISLVSQMGAGGGPVAGGGQIMTYNGASPTADGLIPTNQGQGAIAYKGSGSGPTFTWNTSTHVWQ